MKRCIALSAMVLSANLLAWGPTGHRVVGEIAQRHLSPKAQKEVNLLLKNNSLARVSNWPDEIKSDPVNWGHTYSWHFTDWPDGLPDYDPDHNNGSLIRAIENNLAVLRKVDAKTEEKEVAMKFLVHLVGDLHMPLHIGNGLDRGGNNCKVIWHKEESNLHRVWDENMIEFSRLSYTEFATALNIVSQEEVARIQTGKVLDWALESKTLRNQVYPKEVATDPTQAPPSRNYCTKDVALPQEALPKLGYEYSYQFMASLERRLLEGGLRLAMLINQIYE